MVGCTQPAFEHCFVLGCQAKWRGGGHSWVYVLQVILLLDYFILLYTGLLVHITTGYNPEVIMGSPRNRQIVKPWCFLGLPEQATGTWEEELPQPQTWQPGFCPVLLLTTVHILHGFCSCGSHHPQQNPLGWSERVPSSLLHTKKQVGSNPVSLNVCCICVWVVFSMHFN